MMFGNNHFIPFFDPWVTSSGPTQARIQCAMLQCHWPIEVCFWCGRGSQNHDSSFITMRPLEAIRGLPSNQKQSNPEKLFILLSLLDRFGPL